MLMLNKQELQKWTRDTQTIIVAIDDNSLTVVAPGPITAATGAYKYVTAFGLEVDKVKVSKVNKNKWRINVYTKGETECMN